MRRSRCEERLAGRDTPPYNRQKAVGGGVPDAPRRGQDPSLQTNLKGVRRAACPQAAAGVSGWLPVDGRPRKARRDPSGLACSASLSGPDPSVAPRHLPAQRGVTPLRGAPFARAKPEREASPSGEVAAEQAGRVQPVDGGHSKVAGRACPAPTDCCFRQRGFGGTPEFKVEEGSAALRTDSNTASV